MTDRETLKEKIRQALRTKAEDFPPDSTARHFLWSHSYEAAEAALTAIEGAGIDLMCQASASVKGETVSAPMEPLQATAGGDADEEYDYADLPHPEIRQFVTKLESGRVGLDYRVYEALKKMPLTSRPTENLADALALIPEDWWWHISHLEATVIPTSPAEGMERVLSNASAYDDKGRPIRYQSTAHYDRAQLPRAICAAMLRAVYNLPAAYAVQATATEEESREIIAARQERIAAFRGEHQFMSEEAHRADTERPANAESSLTQINQDTDNG